MRYFIAAIAIIIIIILLVMPVKFTIDFKYPLAGGYLKITTSYLFGLLKPEIYPFDKEKRSRRKKTGLIDRIKSIQRDENYRLFLSTIWNKLIVDSFSWETKIGFKDAYLVGIITGFLWFVKSTIISFILNKKDIMNLNYNIIPVFEKNQLDIQFNCIIKIRMVYIITVWIWMLKLNKGGEKLDRASYRRVNENYNE